MTRSPIRVPQDRRATTGDEDFEALLAFQIQAFKLPVPIRQLRFAHAAMGREWRFDFSWPDLMIAAEVEGGIHSGGRHVRGSGFEEDLDKYNSASILGWRLLRFSTAMVKDGRAMAVLEKALRPRNQDTPHVG